MNVYSNWAIISNKKKYVQRNISKDRKDNKVLLRQI